MNARTPTSLVAPAAPRAARWARDAGGVLAGSVAVALAAQVSVPLPGSPVPVTAQTLAVVLVGIGLGPARGAAALGLYLLQGLIGLPVFAGGSAGPGAFVGPTGGYLLAFPAAAFVAGALASSSASTPRIVLASLASHALIFAAGLSMLARFLPGSALLAAGLFPFLPGTAIKIGAAVAITRGWSLARRGRS